MDGKTKKILNYLKKSGGESEAFDISTGLNMDEDFVQNALNSLVQENLAAVTHGEQGKVFYKLADGENSGGKKAAGKAAAGPEDPFDEFVLENEAVNLVTDTIVTHVDDLNLKAAAAAPPPAPSPSPASAPATAVFEVEDDFSPKPKKAVKKPAAPPPDTGADDDDFSPKPKKKGKEKAPEFDSGAEHDDDNGPKAKTPAALFAAAGIALIIISVLLSAAVSGGKTNSAIAAAERDLIKKLDFDTFKTETDAKIAKLEDENKALETKVKYLEERVKASDKPAAAAKKNAPGGRKR